MEEEAELEQASSLEAIFSGTELPKPCNLLFFSFSTIVFAAGFHTSYQKCVQIVVAVPLFT